MVEKKPLGALTVPGYRYLGPGNHFPNGEPVNRLDAIAKRHDQMYIQAEQYEGVERLRMLIKADEVFVNSIERTASWETCGERVLAKITHWLIGSVLAGRRRQLERLEEEL